MEKVSTALPEVAVSVTDCAEFTADTLAVNDALVAPAGTVTDAGTETALLLLARLTTRPLVPAAAFRETVQASLPAPVKEALLQETALSAPGAATPDPVMFTTRLPVEELLAIVRTPVKLLPPFGVNESVSVAVWPALRVSGVVTPDAENKDPATERLEIVTGLFPVDVRVMVCVVD